MEIVEQCPCHNFASWASIFDFVESDAKCLALKAWLDDDGYQKDSWRLSRPPHVKVRCFEFRWSVQSQLRCSSHGTCQNRRAVAMVIINALREACKHVLDSQHQIGRRGRGPEKDMSNNQQNGTSDIKNVNFDESFPKLMIYAPDTDKPTILTARKKKMTPSVGVKPTYSAAPDPTPAPTPPPVAEQTFSTLHTRSKEHTIMDRLVPPSNLTKSPWAWAVPANESTRAPSSDTTNPSTHASQELMIQRFVNIYSTLLHRHLVPSSPAEVQFLLSLIRLPEEENNQSKVRSKTRNDSPLQALFHTRPQCRQFATLLLAQISSTFLWGWGPHWIFDLLHIIPSCVPLQQRNLLHHIWHEIITTFQHETGTTNLGHFSPISLVSTPIQFFFIQDLRSHAGNTKDVGSWREAQNSSTTGFALLDHVKSSPLMTLPFDEHRDSRHLHKSKEMSSLFQNREQCRDSFLFQLRSFQQLKGSILDPAQMEHYLQDYRISSKDMIQSLSSSNISWFAQFFCDLLMQIGLVPMQETDLDILTHVSDKDRLQKLHKRFTSKVPAKSKPRTQANQSITINLSTVPQPTEYLFTGHQEFFYLFITWTDSHNFQTHLQNRLQYLLSTLMSQPIDASQCHVLILKLCLVARFLGLLNFYPWWTEAHNPAHDLCNCNIPLLEYIKDAWFQGKLCLTIPWVVDYLRMMNWNHQYLRSLYFKNVFGVLRSIHINISFHDYNSTRHSPLYQANKSLVSLFLEGIFSDMVGWADGETLELIEFPPPVVNVVSPPIACIDQSFPFIFCKPLLLLSSSYMDDLTKTVVQMITNTSHRDGADGHTVASKKLKPVSIGQILPPTFSNNVNPKIQLDDPFMALIHKRLVESFFHHHKDLEQICRFVSSQFGKNLSRNVIEYASPIIDSLLENNKLKSSSYLDPDITTSLIVSCEDDVKLRIMGMVDRHCASFVTATLKTLTYSGSTPSYALRISTEVTAAETQTSCLMSISWSFVKRKVEDHVNRTKKNENLTTKSSVSPTRLSKLMEKFHGKRQQSVLLDNSFDLYYGLRKELMSVIHTTKDHKKIVSLLKTLYLSPLDEILSSLEIVIQTSNLGAVDTMNSSRPFVGLALLSEIMQIVSTVRSIGYHSKEASALLSVLSSRLLIENIVSSRDDEDCSRTDSYSNIHEVNSLLRDMIAHQMITKSELSRTLRNLLTRCRLQYVAVRCVTLLGLLKL